MPPMNGSFDATQHTPNQIAAAHPPGIYDASISATSITETKDKTGGMFVVEFSTNAGRISNRYNLWNQSEKARDIAQGQLSALCYATGIFRLDWQNEGAALRGARCKIEVGPQAQDDKYSEIKRVLDAQGNEPGKGPSNSNAQGSQGSPSAQAWGVGGSAPAQGQQPQPSDGNAQGGWGNNQPPANNQQPPQNPQGGWGQPQGGQPPQNNQGWQPANNAAMPAGNGGGNPPWGPQG